MKKARAEAPFTRDQLHKAMRPGHRRCLLLLLAGQVLFADSRNQVVADFTAPLPLPKGSMLVIGVVGGWERWDARRRIVRRIALELREHELPDVWVEGVENHKMQLAEKLVRRAFPGPFGGRSLRPPSSDSRLFDPPACRHRRYR